MTMFTNQTDENGVRMSTNAHPEEEYEHPESRWQFQAKDSVSRAAQRQVFGQIGNRKGTMTFDSLLDGEKR
jgi:hypothetical protein